MTNAVDYRLPNNLDAERFVLGGILVEPDQFSLVTEVLTADDFSLEKHKRIFQRMGELYAKGDRINRISLAQALESHGQLHSVDGLSYLASLDDGMPSLKNIESFCQIVRNKATLRRTIFAAQAVIERCQAQDGPEGVLADAERVTSALNAGQLGRIEARRVAEIIADQGGLNQFLSPERTPGIVIPFPAIHETLSGFRASKLILLAARPAVGKSAFAVQVAETAAATGKRVLIVSLEMSARDLLYRSITGRAQVSTYKFRTGRLSESERLKVQAETSDLVDLNDMLRIADKSQATLQRISAMLRSLTARSSKTDLLVVDYLQLLTTLGRVENRTQQVSEISRGLKQIAQQFEIPVLAVSQLSRKGTQEGREPQLEDLRDSGQLEQDADQVLFLWLKKEPLLGESVREVFWKVAKNRDGILNRGALNFYAKYCRFEECVEPDEAALRVPRARR